MNMRSISRRSFLTTAAAATAASLHARALPTVGVQLYTVRRVLPKNPLETLRAIEQIGYREVECTADRLDDIWPSLKETALKAVSVAPTPPIFFPPPGTGAGALGKTQAERVSGGKSPKEPRLNVVLSPGPAPAPPGGVRIIRKWGKKNLLFGVPR